MSLDGVLLGSWFWGGMQSLFEGMGVRAWLIGWRLGVE